MATRDIGKVGGGIIAPPSDPAVKKLSAQDAKALSASMASEAAAFIKRYLDAPEDQKDAILGERTVTEKIDGFVKDVHAGKIELPPTMKPVEVVAPAIKPFLEAGFSYDIQIDGPMGIGGTTYSFSLQPTSRYSTQDASGVYWDEVSLR